MPKPLEKRFGKYRVELELNYNGEGGNDCRIYYKTPKREYTASLAVAQDTGELETIPEGYAHAINDPGLLDDIEAWAIENGY